MSSLRLTENGDRLLLYTEPSHRQRARSIRGWWWDSSLLCWTYPKDAPTYDAILAEFGQELASDPPPRPINALSDIRLEETETEYLLRVPIEHKDRTRAVPGRTWDAARRRWVWLKNTKTLHMLHATFPELSGVEPTLNSSPSSVSRTLEPEQVRLAAQISELLDRLQRTPQRHTEETEELQQIIKRQQDSITALVDQLGERDQRIAALESYVEQAETAAEDLRRENMELQEQVQSLKGEQVFKRYAKAIALRAARNDSRFAALADRVKAPSTLSIEARKALEGLLKARLNKFHERESIASMLREARDLGTLSPDDTSLARVILNLGNADAHERTNEDTIWARALVSLYASALLWPSLSDSASNALTSAQVEPPAGTA